jgi:hypothetical protein
MIEKLEPQVTGVVCLHCGMQTPFSRFANQGKSASAYAAPLRKVLLIRCSGCGKEAPYLAEEIVVLERFSPAASFAA